MELIERLPLRPIHWLSQLSYSEFSSFCKNDSKNDDESKFTYLENFCKTNLKTGGITKRIYSYSLHTPKGLGGRLFSGGSIQGLPSKIRGLLMRDKGTDIDMSNAHPIILRYICKLHDISCPYLEYYINHRDICLSQFDFREIGKKAYLKATNNDKKNRERGLPQEFKKYDSEMKTIQKKLVVLSEYKELIDSVPLTKSYNQNGSAVNRILCYYENIILQHAIHIVNTLGIEIAVLMFDGFIIYGDYYKDYELIEKITRFVEKQMPGLDMKWAYKEHCMELSVPLKFDESMDKRKSFVCNDLEAAEKLYSLYPHWKYCEEELYVFNDQTGIWKKDRTTHNLITSRFTNQLWIGVKNKADLLEASKVKSYGNTTTLFVQMIEKLKTLCIDDDWLKRSGSSSLGKLLFTNGYFDMRENKFTDGFNPDFVFTGRINHAYTSFNKKEEEYMNSIRKRLFYEPLGEEVSEYLILNLSRGLAGDKMKRILFGLGASNTGKSTITKALTKSCGDYIGSFDGNNFAYRNTGSDTASQNRWLMLLKDKRIVFSNEIKSTVPLNGNLIKMVSSGGDSIVGRKHSGNETEFTLSFLCVLFANDLPKIVPFDDAVNNRARVISYVKPYVENPGEYELKLDPHLDAEIDTLAFQRCFLEILLRQYLKRGMHMEEPVDVIQAKEDWIGNEVGCIPAFLQEFEITNQVEDFVTSGEIQEWLERGKLGITMKKFGMEMKQYTLKNKLANVSNIAKKINGYKKIIWNGIKIIN